VGRRRVGIAPQAAVEHGHQVPGRRSGSAISRWRRTTTTARGPKW
jgi:hypothetical protein